MVVTQQNALGTSLRADDFHQAGSAGFGFRGRLFLLGWFPRSFGSDRFRSQLGEQGSGPAAGVSLSFTVSDSTTSTGAPSGGHAVLGRVMSMDGEGVSHYVVVVL